MPPPLCPVLLVVLALLYVGTFWRDSDEETSKPALSGNMCELVWQGTVQARSFPAFRFQVRLVAKLNLLSIRDNCSSRAVV